MRPLTPDQLLTHHDQGTLWPGGSGVDVPDAYENALAVREMRIARGEHPRGFKVGFTNRTIWPRYNVDTPIWGTVWDTTLSYCEEVGEVSLSGTSQPRLEPETVFGIRETPSASPSLDELYACLDWFAPGFEIVQSHRPGWNFTVPDTVADGGLHAHLLIGARIPMPESSGEAAGFEEQLASARVALSCGGERVDEGRGANVLDGPLHALEYFLGALRACPGAPELHPGDVVTTGTWTDAWPVEPGQRWKAEFDEPLADLEIVLT